MGGFGFESGFKPLLVSHFTAVGFESGFGFEVTGFGFGFKKIEMDSDLSGFGFEVSGFGSGFKMSGFAHHWNTHTWLYHMVLHYLVHKYRCEPSCTYQMPPSCTPGHADTGTILHLAIV